MDLTQQELKRLVTYNPKTGIFTCNKEGAIGGRKEGQILGSPNSRGYLCLRVAGKKYLAHRLAWLFMKGKFPEKLVDHINRNKQDNRWNNLREADHLSNAQNNGKPCVDFRKGKYRARICVNYKEVFIGAFDTYQEAEDAYYTAKQHYRVFKE